LIYRAVEGVNLRRLITMMACTSENMAKSVAAGDAMQEGPVKRAMLKELGDANTAMSKGDMRGACKSYMRAQKMGSTES
jgi:hypothetical protein